MPLNRLQYLKNTIPDKLRAIPDADFSHKPIDNYILDFFCYDLMLGIEVDGYSHEFVEVYNKDVVKETKMSEFGISVLRFSDYQVMKDTENVIRTIEQYILEFEANK